MSFFERARAGYDNLAGRTDDAFDRATASKDLGEIDKHYRDLGVLAYLAATGRPADQATQQRLLGALTALEQRGAIRDFTLHTTGGSPPEHPSPHSAKGVRRHPDASAGAGRPARRLPQPAARPGLPGLDDASTGPARRCGCGLGWCRRGRRRGSGAAGADLAGERPGRDDRPAAGAAPAAAVNRRHLGAAAAGQPGPDPVAAGPSRRGVSPAQRATVTASSGGVTKAATQMP